MKKTWIVLCSLMSATALANDYSSAGSIRSLSDSETGTFQVAMNGPWTGSQTIAIHYSRVGSTVTLLFPGVQLAAVAGVAVATSNLPTPSQIPFNLRPVIEITNPSAVIFNNAGSTATPGAVTITNLGDIAICFDSTCTNTWGGSGNNGWQPFTITYIR